MTFLLYGVIFIIFTLTRSELVLPNNDSGEDNESKFLHLIQRIQSQHEIQTVFVKYEYSIGLSCPDLDYSLQRLNATAIVMETIRKSKFLKGSINTKLLSIVCLNKISLEFEIVWRAFFSSLRGLRDIKILLYVNQNESVVNMKNLRGFFDFCWLRKSLNILAIFKDFSKTNHLHGYKPFPHFEMELRQVTFRDQIYPKRLKNLMGHNLFTLPDQIIPRTFLFNNENDQVHISGYVGLFVHLLAERLNATLKYPFAVKKGQVLYFSYLEALTRNYTIDIPGTLASVRDVTQIPFSSYPFAVAQLCLAIPRSKNVPLYEVFFYLVNFKMICISMINLLSFTCLLNLQRFIFYGKHRGRKVKNHHLLKFSDYILNDIALRGILGQPFKMIRKPEFFTKYIYVLLSLAGLYLSLVYNALLQTFFTRPIKRKQLKTFKDLHDNNVYTLLSNTGLSYFSSKSSNFSFLSHITSFEELIYMRNTLNTSYAFPEISTHWNSLFTDQKNLFRDQLFIFSENACFPHTILLSFPLAQDSIYRGAVNELIIAVNENGMLQHWLNTYFFNDLPHEEYRLQLMTSTSSMSFRQPLKVNDFKLVLMTHGVLMLLGILVFFMERIFYEFTKLLHIEKVQIGIRKI